MATSKSLSQKRIPLNNGTGALPAVGFGTLILDLGATQRAVKAALEVGYRQFDCAELYGNEQVVGNAIREAFQAKGLGRGDLFVSTKLWNHNHRPERVVPALEASLRRLQLDYVDCYLIHTPFAFAPGDDQNPRDEHGQPIYDSGVTLLETWGAIERCVDEGKCRSVGLSDIGMDKLKEIVASSRIKPAIVQIESHPYLPEREILSFCQQSGIVMQAFAPLGHGLEPRVTEDPVIVAIARRIKMTPAQVALAWAVQRGTAFLTTSASPDHIRENFAVSSLPEDALREMDEKIVVRVRFNAVVETGMPGFVPRRE